MWGSPFKSHLRRCTKLVLPATYSANESNAQTFMYTETRRLVYIVLVESGDRKLGTVTHVINAGPMNPSSRDYKKLHSSQCARVRRRRFKGRRGVLSFWQRSLPVPPSPTRMSLKVGVESTRDMDSCQLITCCTPCTVELVVVTSTVAWRRALWRAHAGSSRFFALCRAASSSPPLAFEFQCVGRGKWQLAQVYKL